MSFLVMMGLGFVGLVSTGFHGAEPIPITPWAGARTAGHFAALEGRPLAIESQVSTKPIIFIPIHVASHFPFVTTVKDDGKDSSGGWQEAKASLPFGKAYPYGVKMWYCPITIGMPIRHSVKGYISPATAATESARVTNSVARNMDFDLPQGIFCRKFVTEVKAAFPIMYPVAATVGL